MGIASIPSAGGGGIKSVQRGSAGGSGTVTITAVDISKSFVTVFGTSSSGTVSASFGLNSATHAISWGAAFLPNFGGGRGLSGSTNLGSNQNVTAGDVSYYNGQGTMNAMGVNAGSNNLVAATVQGYLSNSTSLVVSGACRWEVVEFN